ANRGEIAVRVARTAHRMGIHVIAVYSDTDAAAMHVAVADEAVRIGPDAAAKSYLNIDAVLEAARLTGAEAVHPGYGFLAENDAFAGACEEAGIIFVGPSAETMRKMAFKHEAKKIMADAGIPVTPGGMLEDDDLTTAKAIAQETGYPILIKPVAGGGGKGMHRVASEHDLEASLAAARREAASSFDDDRLMIEKLIERPRHIEVQIFADRHGNAVHLFERDCSIQRRYQKVIEEAPAFGLSDDMRAAMTAAAVSAARAVDYRGAGTIEFIVEADTFYFMEMNTRLQVEHPVTEMITGVDLVEWQFLAAAGEVLPKTQDEISVDGHAIEARIYAEDSLRNFMPASGQIDQLIWPPENERVRLDTGVQVGDEVGVYYDPMIAKLAVSGKDRQAALSGLSTALGETEIEGLSVNIDFLGAVIRHPEFAAGHIDTGFITRHWAELAMAAAGISSEAVILACLYLDLERPKDVGLEEGADIYSPWQVSDGWQANLPSVDRFRFQVSVDRDTPILDVEVLRGADRYEFRLPGHRAEVGSAQRSGDRVSALIDGVLVEGEVSREGARLSVTLKSNLACRLYHLDPRALIDRDEEAGGSLNAPLPGKIVEIFVGTGDKVEKGETLLVMEAMKMEYSIKAPGGGVVAALHCAAEDQVKEGDVLIELTAEE
ncbi:MAG: 3-methylcrotonyl-CoA carboxylase, partial [Proteobacteria bacterium]|nr:3-methylcrotonyl-CoA carboxylase [Pseudomonadota bacterium]